MTDIKKGEIEGHWVVINLGLWVGAAECADEPPVKIYELIEGKISP